MNGKDLINLDPYAENLQKLTEHTMAIVSISTSLLSANRLLTEQYNAMYKRLKEIGIDWDTDPENSLSEGNIKRKKLQEAAEKMKAKRGKTNA